MVGWGGGGVGWAGRSPTAFFTLGVPGTRSGEALGGVGRCWVVLGGVGRCWEVSLGGSGSILATQLGGLILCKCIYVCIYFFRSVPLGILG